MTGLLVRDLAQVVTHLGDGAALRGPDLREVVVLDRAYVLIGEDGALVSVGAMVDLPPLADDVDELDGSGLSAIPGLVDCHTHPAFAGDRVELSLIHI